MARPKPTILMEHTENVTGKTEQILEAEAIYAVFFRGKPINLKSLNKIVSHSSTTYKKVSFSNSAHAFNLADRLNDKFKTQEFEVVKMTQGAVVHDRTQIQ